MNCEEVKANLSPYVAGDIERHGARETIAAHLSECDACRTLAVEWEASHQLLQLHRPPEFDAAFFDSVRRDVMRQISEPKPSLLARLLGRPFGQRTLTYAAAFSVLVCAVILSAHFLRGRQTPPAEVVREEDKGGPVKTASPQSPVSPPTSEGRKKSSELAVSAPATGRRRTVRPARVAATRDARGENLLRDEPEENSLTANRLKVGPPNLRGPRPNYEEYFGAEPEATNAASANQVETVASAEREMLRIELQTADPNIRIIWLSPRTTGSASSSKTNR